MSHWGGILTVDVNHDDYIIEMQQVVKKREEGDD